MRVFENVRDYIHANGLKQRAVAKKAGFTDSTFSAMLNGKRAMHADDLVAISRALDVSVTTLIDPGMQEEPA